MEKTKEEKPQLKRLKPYEVDEEIQKGGELIITPYGIFKVIR